MPSSPVRSNTTAVTEFRRPGSRHGQGARRTTPEPHGSVAGSTSSNETRPGGATAVGLADQHLESISTPLGTHNKHTAKKCSARMLPHRTIDDRGHCDFFSSAAVPLRQHETQNAESAMEFCSRRPALSARHPCDRERGPASASGYRCVGNARSEPFVHTRPARTD